MYVCALSLQIEKEAQTWLDSDSDEEGEKAEKKPEETRMEAAPESAESSEPQPGTSKDTEEMERSPMEYFRADEGEMEELQGAVGGSDSWTVVPHLYVDICTIIVTRAMFTMCVWYYAAAV